MIAFWVAAMAMAAVALAFLVPRLLRRAGASSAESLPRAVRAKLASLTAAHAHGHVSEDDYRRRREELVGRAPQPAAATAPSRRRAPATAWALLVTIPLAAVALYLLIGDPRAIVAAPVSAPATAGANDPSQAPELNEAITQLAARLAQNPGDVDGWFLLGRSYMAVQRHQDARDAFARALDLAPGEPALMVEYAEAIAFASGEPRLPAEAETLLRDALAMQPDSQKALWLLGIGAYQRQDYPMALDYWERLNGLLEPDGAVARQLAQQIAAARTALGEDPPAPTATPAPAETTAARVVAEANDESAPPVAETRDERAVAETSEAPPPTASAGGEPALMIDVSLADELRPRVGPNDTVFVFARAVTGPRVPLAIQRLPAASLPARVRLDNSMSMMPNMNLTTFPEVVVGARISRSGNAVPQPGDLEALSDPVSSQRREPVRLRIDKVL